MLVQADAKLNLVDFDGITALDYAVDEDRQVIGEYLRSHGGKCHSEEYPASW